MAKELYSITDIEPFLYSKELYSVTDIELLLVALETFVIDSTFDEEV